MYISSVVLFLLMVISVSVRRITSILSTVTVEKGGKDGPPLVRIVSLYISQGFAGLLSE